MQLFFSVESGEIRAVVRDERVILSADFSHQLPILVPAKPDEVHVFAHVPGLMRDPQKPDTIIPHLQTGEVDGLKKSGVVDKGMIPKVDSAVAAIKAGVEKVSFVDGRVPHSVLLEIFTDEGVGTEVVL